MTTEEKAKAYDEAMNKIKPLYEQAKKDGNPIWSTYEYLIPELKESKDEKMLREIKRYVKEQGDKPNGLPNGTVAISDMIAWLEKQKEASKAIEAVERIDKYIDENLANAHDMKDSNPDKKYYRGWDDALGEMARILQDVYSREKQKETGIRWLKSDNVKNPDKPYIDNAGMFYTTDGRMCYASEIEKQKGETLRDFIDNFPYSDEQKEQKPAEYIKRNSKEWYSLLAEQYDKGFWKGKAEQKSAEWSEEDENMLWNIISIVGESKSIQADEMLDWLKSLRPSWKPSEEQMKALLNTLHPDDPYYPDLKSLYEQLKAL